MATKDESRSRRVKQERPSGGILSKAQMEHLTTHCPCRGFGRIASRCERHWEFHTLRRALVASLRLAHLVVTRSPCSILRSRFAYRLGPIMPDMLGGTSHLINLGNVTLGRFVPALFVLCDDIFARPYGPHLNFISATARLLLMLRMVAQERGGCSADVSLATLRCIYFSIASSAFEHDKSALSPRLYRAWFLALNRFQNHHGISFGYVHSSLDTTLAALGSTVWGKCPIEQSLASLATLRHSCIRCTQEQGLRNQVKILAGTVLVLPPTLFALIAEDTHLKNTITHLIREIIHGFGFPWMVNSQGTTSILRSQETAPPRIPSISSGSDPPTSLSWDLVVGQFMSQRQHKPTITRFTQHIGIGLMVLWSVFHRRTTTVQTKQALWFLRAPLHLALVACALAGPRLGRRPARLLRGLSGLSPSTALACYFSMRTFDPNTLCTNEEFAAYCEATYKVFRILQRGLWPKSEAMLCAFRVSVVRPLLRACRQHASRFRYIFGGGGEDSGDKSLLVLTKRGSRPLSRLVMYMAKH